MNPGDSERFAAGLRGAEERLRAHGLTGRRGFAALTRHLAAQLNLDERWWPDGPDAPPQARLDALGALESGHAGAAGLDLFGLAYERFFPDLFKGAHGQYFTPRPLVDLMVTLAGVRAGEHVLDPTCGAGGFLVSAAARGAHVYGVEVDPDLATLARLNLALAGHPPEHVQVADFFALPVDGAYDVILANPPFSVAVTDPDVLRRYTLASGRARVGSDTLFLEAALRWLAPGGRLVTVLPYAVLVNPGYAAVRRWVEANASLDAVISLPEGVFLPFGGTMTRACVLGLRKGPPRPALAAVITCPGYDVHRKRYKRREPDELAALTAALPHHEAATAWRWVDPAVWLPECALAGGAHRPNPETPLLDLADPAPPTPAPEPGTPVWLVDFADIDKDTGELVGARTGLAGERAGQPLAAGDLLFGRMRPELNNVGLVPATPDLPAEGSSEWLRLRPRVHPHFVTLALRSGVVRARLAVRSGQTRPRTTAAAIHALTVPDPGVEVRGRLDAALAEILAERRRLRARLLVITTLYEAFARGELDVSGLTAGLDALEAKPRSPQRPSPPRPSKPRTPR